MKEKIIYEFVDFQFLFVTSYPDSPQFEKLFPKCRFF